LRALWGELARPGRSVLQIGAGSGHLLAAARRAGCSVAAVEPSKAHRDFIRDVWNIELVYASLAAVPAGRAYDTIVAADVLGRVYDVPDFLAAIRRLLAPGGTCYLSAPNARSVEASVLGAWWPACKDADQVSIPSAAGLATAARQSRLQVRRIWSTGQPLEFPVSALLAARDRARAGRRVGRVPRRGESIAHSPAIVHAGDRAALANFHDLAALVDPSNWVLGSIGRAPSLNAVLLSA
jgi:SAM-dependent methyltransferase